MNYENVYGFTGDKAYAVTLDMLKSVNYFPYPIQTLYPSRFFYYGEDGWGLLLAEGVAWISSESVEDIRGIEDEFKIGTSGFLENPRWKNLNGQIPNGKVDSVVDFVCNVAMEVGVQRIANTKV